MADRDDILDVELRIVGQESLGPLAQLVDQLAKITQYQAGMSGLSPEGRVAAARGMVGDRNLPTPSGTAGTHSEPPDREEMTPRGRGGFIERWATRRANEEENESYDHMRARGVRRPMHIEGGWHGDVEGGSGSGSVPPPPESQQTLRRLRSDLGAFGKGEEPFEYPRFGSLTWQDRAILLSEGTQKLAVRSLRKQEKRLEAGKITQEEYDAYDPKVAGASLANATQVLRSGGAVLGVAQGVHADAKAIMARVTGSQEPGIQAGYNKAGEIGIGPFGITNPFQLLGNDSAGQETLNQWWTKQRLRMKGGINGEQASEIVNSLAALGWNGEEGQGVALDTISPLVQQGLNPTMTSTMFDKSMRHGNSAIKDFNATMNKLGESAAASKMSLNEFQQALDAAGDAAKQQGGLYLRGVDAARDFSDATGLGPQALSQTWSSPLVQGMAMSKFGTMPNAMGTMTGNMGVRNTYAALDVAKQATSMFATRDTVDPTTGEVVSGKRAQYAQMAPLMGMSAEEVERLDRQRGVVEASARGLGRINAYRQGYKQDNAKKDRDAYMERRMDKDGLTEEEARGEWESKFSANNQNWESIKRSMYQTAGETDGLKSVEKKEIKKISEMTGTDRLEAAERFLREQNKFGKAEDPNTIHVKFTGTAEKLLMVDRNRPGWPGAKDDAGAGKKPSNGQTSSPQGASTNSEAQALIDSLNAQRGNDGLPPVSIPPGAVPSTR